MWPPVFNSFGSFLQSLYLLRDSNREYWIIYRGQGFLAVIWFGSFAAPPPPITVSKLDRRHTGRLRKRDNLLTGEGVGGGWGAESYNCQKTWSSVNHSILSGQHPLTGIPDQKQSYSGQKKSPKLSVCLSLCISKRKLEGEGVCWGGSLTVCVTMEFAFLCVNDNPLRTSATQESEMYKNVVFWKLKESSMLFCSVSYSNSKGHRALYCYPINENWRGVQGRSF